MMNKAFFLDRDGVINVEVNYLHEPDKVELIPGVVEALRLIHSRGYLALVVTNQAGVAKGYYPESDVQAVHRRITELLEAAGTCVDGFYYCIHHPDFTGSCDCRKPAPSTAQPGMPWPTSTTPSTPAFPSNSHKRPWRPRLRRFPPMEKTLEGPAS